MGGTVLKSELFARLGYGGPYGQLEEVLQAAGLSRPEKEGIACEKEPAVREALAERFLPVCSRGDCRGEASDLADGRTVVPASSQANCGVCGGSANGRALDEMVEAFHAAGLRRLVVVGGSPNTRAELERLLAGRLDCRLVDGELSRPHKQSDADLDWADRVVIWGGTILAHKVSKQYHGPHVIQMARRSIQELAREVVRSLRGRAG